MLLNMATAKRFEDLRVWQEAEKLVRAIYGTTNRGPFAKDFPLRDQIRRAAISTMSNIAEGFERGTNREFLQFLHIAKGSNGELRSQLHVATGQGYLTKEEFDVLHQTSEALSRQIASFIAYLRKRATEKRVASDSDNEPPK